MTETETKGKASGTASSRRSRSAPRDPVQPGDGQAVIRTQEEADAERRSVTPVAAGGPGHGRLTKHPDTIGKDGTAEAVDTAAISEPTGDVLVKLTENVYEEYDLPGTDRKGHRLLFAKGKTVKQSELDRYAALAQQGS